MEGLGKPGPSLLIDGLVAYPFDRVHLVDRELEDDGPVVANEDDRLIADSEARGTDLNGLFALIEPVTPHVSHFSG